MSRVPLATTPFYLVYSLGGVLAVGGVDGGGADQPGDQVASSSQQYFMQDRNKRCKIIFLVLYNRQLSLLPLTDPVFSIEFASIFKNMYSSHNEKKGVID